jgi:hypothetical protein
LSFFFGQIETTPGRVALERDAEVLSEPPSLCQVEAG